MPWRIRMVVYAVNIFQESALPNLRLFFTNTLSRFQERQCEKCKTYKNGYKGCLTKKVSIFFNGVDSTVDKLSKLRKHNFFYFLVDKTYTLVVYFVHEVNKRC